MTVKQGEPCGHAGEYGQCDDCFRERMRAGTDPKLLTVQFNMQALETRDKWTKNGARAKRILKMREEKREGLTDLRYNRRVSADKEAEVLGSANADGIRPKGVFG